MDIFNSEPGQVSVFEDSRVLPGAVMLTGVGGPAAFSAAIIQNLSANWSTGQQFQLTLEQALYMYVFGDNPSDIVIEGTTFSSSCAGDGRSGIETIMEFYEKNRVVASVTPVFVQIGSKTVSGFLTEMMIYGFNPELLTNQFRLKVNLKPGGARQ